MLFYKTSGAKVFWSHGVWKILALSPVATKKNLLSGLNAMAETASRKLKCAITTFFVMLIMILKPSVSIEISVCLSGERHSLAIFDLFWKGNVYDMLVVRFIRLILFPTGLSKISSIVSPS